MRRILLTLLAFLVFTINALAPATTVLTVSLPEKVSWSQNIVEGKVIGKTCFENAQGIICTRITLQTSQHLKGTGGETFSFNVPGGRVGDRVLLIHGFPQFHIGEDTILFLTAEATNGLRVPIGYGQGKYAISRDPQTGEKLVREEPLIDVNIVSPRTGRPAQAPPREPRNYDNFVREVRQLVERGR